MKQMTTARKNLAHKRLSARELAGKLGNTTDVCRRHVISRTQFYDYKRRFQANGFAGLAGLPPVHVFPETA
jgi:hypothetical protein